MPTYVVSSTLVDPAWSNTTVISGELDEHVAKMKQAHDGDITVHGSTQLVHALLEQDLVDELRLMVFPVILGAGQRLFGQTSDKMALRLVESRTVGDGVTIVTYATVRRATTAVDGAGVETERAAAFARAGTREGA